MYFEINYKNCIGKFGGGVGLFIGKEFGCLLLIVFVFSFFEYIIINV